MRRVTGSARLSLTVTLILIVILGVGLIGASPLALKLFGGATAGWERLSFIGGTYGAASAILAVLAVIGVAITLILQARESRAMRLHAIRDNHNHLIEMAMNDPDLNKVWGPGGLTDPFVAQRQSMYANMIVSQWQMSYETRSLTEPTCASSPASSSPERSAATSGRTPATTACPPRRAAASTGSTDYSTRNTGRRWRPPRYRRRNHSVPFDRRTARTREVGGCSSRLAPPSGASPGFER